MKIESLHGDKIFVLFKSDLDGMVWRVVTGSRHRHTLIEIALREGYEL